MAYVDPNFKSKKALKDAVASGATLRPYNPGGMFPVPSNGRITLEGPHYPEPHRWYATATVVNGVVVKVA
jgi:hypothetical protein